MYERIYKNLCESRKSRKLLYKRGSELHAHHITPKHFGGGDEEENITYLTVREHIIAHFLLWKINREPNDIRAMKMLGANLSFAQRKIIGEFCRDNKIGFYSGSVEEKFAWRKKGIAVQHKNKIGIHDPAAKPIYASMGGKVGGVIQYKNKVGIHNPEKRNHYASLGGKSIKGMICVTNGTHRTRIKPEKLEEFLSMGYVRGFTLFSESES